MPAKLLTKVNLNGKSELTSASVLSNSRLRVIMAKGEFHLRSNGKVITGSGDFDFCWANAENPMPQSNNRAVKNVGFID